MSDRKKLAEKRLAAFASGNVGDEWPAMKQQLEKLDRLTSEPVTAPDAGLADLLERVKNLPPMTPGQMLEQKVSFVYGMLGSKNTLTKEQVREMVLRQAGITP